MSTVFNLASTAFIIGGVSALVVDFTGTTSSAAEGIGKAFSWVGELVGDMA